MTETLTLPTSSSSLTAIAESTGPVHNVQTDTHTDGMQESKIVQEGEAVHSVLVTKCALTTHFLAQLLRSPWSGTQQRTLAPLTTTQLATDTRHNGCVTLVAMGGRPG